jgi:hypothetical protein
MLAQKSPTGLRSVGTRDTRSRVQDGILDGISKEAEERLLEATRKRVAEQYGRPPKVIKKFYE